MATFVAAVIRPLASTVITGTCVADPYVPALTPVFANVTTPAPFTEAMSPLSAVPVHALPFHSSTFPASPAPSVPAATAFP